MQGPCHRTGGSWAKILAAAILGTLGGCGGGGSASSTPAQPQAASSVPISVRIFAFDSTTGGWRPNNGRWYAYAQSRDPCTTEFGGFPNNPVSPPSCFVWLTGSAGPGSDWISSRGPWWVDPNHRPVQGGDGYGFVHVVAFVQVPAALYGPLDLTGSVASFLVRKDAAFTTVMADSRDGLRKGHVYLWLQTHARPVADCTPDPSSGENCTRQSDYILTGKYDPAYELDSLADAAGKEVSLTLSADEPALWTCLGRGENIKYECEPIADALREVAAVGLMMAPVAPCPAVSAADGTRSCDLQTIDGDPGRYFAQGTIDIKDFRIRYPELRTAAAEIVQFPAAAAATRWTPPVPAGAQTFGPGSGLHLPRPIAAGAMRIGLSTQMSPTTLDSGGLQLYLITAGVEPNLTENQIRVVGRSDDGRYDKVLFIAPFGPQDSFSLHRRGDRIVFMRNDVALHSEPAPCPAVGDCVLTPFISLYGATVPVPVYRYSGG